MKKTVLLCIFLWSFQHVSAQNYYMTSPEGYGEAATGGGTPTVSNTVLVDTYAKLQTALNSTSSSNAVILVSGIIDCPYTSVLLSNKTILGLPGAKLRNLQITVGNSTTSAANSGIINIKPGSNNVIIRNLIFEGPGAYDVDGKDNLTNEATNIWVDHCEFQDGMDGNFDNKGKADNVSISWCKFTYLKTPISGGSGGTNDHRFTDLIGSSATDFPTDGNYSVTFKNCYWAEGCKERMPRARNAQLHILNCYYKTTAASSKAIGLGGGNKNTTCYVENSNFEQVTSIYTPYSTDGGTIGVKFDGCTKGTTPAAVTGLDAGTAPAKPIYTYTVLPAADIAAYITNENCGAGATLQVSATGIISSTCSQNLAVKDYALNSIKLYPTFVDDALHIEFSNAILEDAVIDIYSMTGAKVLTYKSNSLSDNNIVVNVAQLAKGAYLCTIATGETANTLKFIKK
ncbi:pectate lyase [Flavobacterium sp. CF108]|uniref:T9SS type A sorting domain-containing protein n=1 Tax=unclassified Flavobacterium TaxID=196869 RepID=UPI0008CF4E66|nr:MULTISPECIES: T9SS type A sorting domain-containing protein [unclassified Flavobacterium]SEO21263.1 pectate lyase [Flavobacterium sp. fv08]SHG51798.1 pectate lyase [Flavobacterium sp. CF108]